NDFFEIVDTALYTKASFDFELQNSYVILVEAEDKQGYSLQEFVEIWVMNVNETPLELSLSDTLVYEDAPVGSYVGTFDATDPDYFDQFRFRLVAGQGDNDNAKFRIDGNNLYTKALFDFEKQAELSIRVEVLDQGNAGLIKIFRIAVLDVNEAPTAILLSKHTILENQPVNTLVGRFSAIDPDAGNSFNYLFAMGENDIDNASFNIRGDSLITDEMFDFEKKSTYFIRIMTVDQDGAVFERSFTIVVQDVDENPKAITDIRLSKHEVPENETTPAFVGKLSTIGGIPEFSYDFVIGDGDYDNHRFMISNDSLYALVSFDFENRSLYFVRIQTTDNLGESMSKLMLILAEDLNESPYALNLFNNVIDEQQPAYSLVSTIVSFDQDKGDLHNYSLVAGEGDADNAYFIIRGDSLLTADVLYFDQKAAYSIRLQTTDLGGMSYSTNTTVILNKLSGLGQNTSDALNALLGENELIVHAVEFGGKRIVLHNLLGQVILSEELHSQMSNFKLNNLPKGVYLLSIYDKDVLIQKIKISRN
ncbi:MAG: T9SS type A sorting domain-containing protein, partial [Bacteroidales bacterium]|nr:T9SS type A sorting domain-containing protein [Bacteroidales bacterium]